VDKKNSHAFHRVRWRNSTHKVKKKNLWRTNQWCHSICGYGLRRSTLAWGVDKNGNAYADAPRSPSRPSSDSARSLARSGTGKGRGRTQSFLGTTTGMARSRRLRPSWTTRGRRLRRSWTTTTTSRGLSQRLSSRRRERA
jgi:hypothetical protein